MKSSPLSLDSLKPGDIIGFSGFNPASYFINLMTYGLPGWGISHVGIVAAYPNGRQDINLIFESTDEASTQCYVQNAYVTGTQAQLVEPRLEAYAGRIWHYPLVKPLKSWESKALTRFLMGGLGRRYDATDAPKAGLKLWAWANAQWYPENMESIFCSEWVAAAHRFIERFDTPNISSWSPNALLREERRRGILQKPVRLK